MPGNPLILHNQKHEGSVSHWNFNPIVFICVPFSYPTSTVTGHTLWPSIQKTMPIRTRFRKCFSFISAQNEHVIVRIEGGEMSAGHNRTNGIVILTQHAASGSWAANACKVKINAAGYGPKLLCPIVCFLLIWAGPLVII